MRARVKFGPLWAETCKIEHFVMRDNEIKVQVSYPVNSASFRFFTEIDIKQILKIESENQMNTKIINALEQVKKAIELEDQYMLNASVSNLESIIEPKPLKITPETIKLELTKLLISEGQNYDFEKNEYPEAFKHLNDAAFAFDKYLELKK